MKPLRTLEMTRPVYDAIRREVGTRRAESGGILLGRRSDFAVTEFVFDPHGSTTGAGYDPDTDYLNRRIKELWESRGLELLGFVHSHPPGVTRLSGDWGHNTGDLGYIQAIFDAIPALEYFLAPLVFTLPDTGAFRILPFVASRRNVKNYWRADLSVDGVPVDHDLGRPEPQRPALQPVPTPPEPRPAAPAFNHAAIPATPPAAQAPAEPSRLAPPPCAPAPRMDTSRLMGAVNTYQMRQTHVLCIGLGGANGLVEDLVRSGLGRLTAMDFDRVDASNLCTQGFELGDVGKLKVDALGERVKRINPELHYQGLNQDFLKLNEQQADELVQSADLVLMMTDDFHAQARGNVLALRHQKPALFAMVYEKARAAEVSFTIPGVTPGCHRCAVSPRYRAYLEEGYQNDVRSTGSTVFHTRYLNACIGLLALAILHRQDGYLELGGWFGDHWDRNLLQVRMNPQYGRDHPGALFHQLGAANPRVFAFDSVWQRIEPEAPPTYPACPDCGGGGDLRRVMPSAGC